jgi:DNA-binding MarR family transcriptional regulator
MIDDLNNVKNCDPRLCFASKFRKLDKVVQTIYRQHISQFNLTTSQLSVLFVLSKKPKATQTELCKILLLDKSSLNRNLNRLFEKELISKQSKFEIIISNNGLHLLEKVIPHWDIAQKKINSLLKEEGTTALNLIMNNLC